MKNLFLVLTGIFFLGFIIGLGGKSSAINKKSVKRSDFYQKIIIVSLILMVLFAILYSLVD